MTYPYKLCFPFSACSVKTSLTQKQMFIVLYVENQACVDLPGIVHRQLGDLQLPDLSGKQKRLSQRENTPLKNWHHF